MRHITGKMILKSMYMMTIGGIMALVLTACADDKGNYDYHDINEITIDGIPTDEVTTKVSFIDNLTIDPQIHSSFGIDDEANYEFTWIILPFGKDFDQIDDIDACTFSHSRKIDRLVTWNPGDYSVFFKVKDNSNGLTTIKSFKLRVKSTTSEGWLVLCDDNGKPRMDVIFNVSETEDLVAHNLWQNIDFNPGRPQRIIYNYQLHETSTLLVTDKTTYNLDVTDLHYGEDNELIWRFGATPEYVRVAASAKSQFAVNNYWIIVNDEGEVFTLDINNNGLFEFPLNRIDGKTEFKAAPFIGVCYNNTVQGAPIAYLYDETHRQFLVIRNNSQYPSVTTFNEATPLFSAQTGRDMLWMESTKTGEVYALLKDPADGKVYFYGMEMNGKYVPADNWWQEGTYEEYNYQHYYGEVIGEGIGNATMYAFHNQFPYLFYVSGNKVYQFDMGHPEEPAVEVLSYPGETIRCIRFCPMTAWEKYEEWERQRTYQLVVATNSDDAPKDRCGNVRFYGVPNLMEPLTLIKEHHGLGNIVDITYKERKK